MSRNSSHSRNFDQTSASGWLSIIVKTILILLAIIIAAEWGAGIVLDQVSRDSEQLLTAQEYNEERVVLQYDTKEPESYIPTLEETVAFHRFIHTPGQAYRLQPFQGESVTIDTNGIRGIPASTPVQNTVFLFGNSTAAGFGVKDTETIAAYLQDDLVSDGRSVHVINFGTPLYTSSSERFALERQLLEGQHPNLVIFLNGLEEFRQCLPVSGNSFSESLSRAIRNWAILPSNNVEQWQNEFLRLWHQTNLYHLFQWWNTRQEKTEKQLAFCQSEAGVTSAINRLEANRKIIAGMADQFGFKILFVQQPVPLWHYNNGKRAVVAKGDVLKEYAATAKGYQKMDALRQKSEIPNSVLWLAELEPAEGNAYIDDVHYSPRMNAAIAKAIADKVAKDNLLPRLSPPTTSQPLNNTSTIAKPEPPTPTAVPVIAVEATPLAPPATKPAVTPRPAPPPAATPTENLPTVSAPPTTATPPLVVN